MFLDAVRSFRRSLLLSRRPASRRRGFLRPAAAAERLEDRALLSAVTFVKKFESVDWTSSAAGSVGSYWTGGASATLNVSGVQGTVAAAYLYWQGFDLTAYGGDGVYDNAAVTFDGTAVTGVSLGVGCSAGWGTGSSQAFRADVTSLVQAGKSVYNVAGLASKPGHTADGVSLVVVYQDGDRTNDRDLYLLDGNAINAGPGADGLWNVRLDDFTYRSGDVRVQMHVADGQSWPDDTLTFGTTAAPNYAVSFPEKVGTFDGTSVPDMGHGRAFNGSLWDVHTFDLSAAFSNPAAGPGTYSLTLNESGSPMDALSLVVLLYDTQAAPFNTPPVANDVSLSGPEDQVLAGRLDAHDAQGDATLTYSLVTRPAWGALNLDPATGCFTFTPPKDCNGTVSFTYAASDGQYSATATVTLTITPVDDPPVANPQAAVTDEDTPIASPVAAFDPDGDPLSFALVTGPAHGTLALAADGTYLFTPDAGWNGTDAFQVSVTDGKSDPVLVLVSLTVNPVNDPPVAGPQSATADEDTPLSGRVVATDVDGDPLTFRLIAGPKHGGLAFATDGTYVFTPFANWFGDDGFQVTVTDGKSVPVAVLVSPHINAVNDPPTVAAQQSASTDEDTPLAGQIDATDVDGDALSFLLVGGPAHGTLALAADGSYVFSPNANWWGDDAFKVAVTDGKSDPVTVLVSVHVNPVNDPPVAAPATFQVADHAAAGTLVGKFAATDDDGDALTYAITAGNTGGTFALDPKTSVLTVADARLLDGRTNPVFTLTLTASDGHGGVATALVTVRVLSPSVSLSVGLSGSKPVVNLDGPRWQPLVIYSTATFDARQIDVASLTFGRTGNERSFTIGSGGHYFFAYIDVNGDGRKDLVLLFDARVTALTPADTTATLKGHLKNGTTFTDSTPVTVKSKQAPAPAAKRK